MEESDEWVEVGWKGVDVNLGRERHWVEERQVLGVGMKLSSYAMAHIAERLTCGDQMKTISIRDK
jgi:hypothetical protein